MLKLLLLIFIFTMSSCVIDESVEHSDTVIPKNHVNHALNQSTHASFSSSKTSDFFALLFNNHSSNKITDNELSTYWTSGTGDNEFVEVDLNVQKDIGRVVLYWGKNASQEYKVLISDDAENWLELAHERYSNGGIDDISVLGKARYIRIQLINSYPVKAVSLYEIKVYEKQNLLSGQPIAIHASSMGGNGDPKNMLDGDPSTQWIENDKFAQIDIVLDTISDIEFIGLKAIEKKPDDVDLYTSQQDIKVYLYASNNNEDWTFYKSYDVTNTLQISTPKLNAKYLRFSLLSKEGDSLSIQDIYAFGSATSAIKNLNSNRGIIDLTGDWNITTAHEMSLPSSFEYTAPVPGFIDSTDGLPELEDNEAYFYRTTFTIPGDIPEQAILNVRKARYGSKVYVNGYLVGDSLFSYTLNKYEISKVLKGNNESNELIIRVGSRDSIDSKINTGEDWHDIATKTAHVAGIYDEVFLDFSGEVTIQKAQVVTDINKGTATIHATLQNFGAHKSDYQLNISVNDPDGNSVANEVSIFNLPEGVKYEFEITVSIDNVQLWDMGSPKLYSVSITSDHDHWEDKFGFRELYFDSKTKMPVMNGVPRYIHGTNIALNRFYGDSQRGSLPWDETWIRSLYQEMINMNWYYFRTHVGVMPEIWYRIADEMGIAIQDEYSLWYGFGWGVNQTDTHSMKLEMEDWLFERVNHPSVVMFDSLNETGEFNDFKYLPFPGTYPHGKYAAMGAMHADYSNRPWEHAWTLPLSDNQPYEVHPYFFLALKVDVLDLIPYELNREYTLSELNTANRYPHQTESLLMQFIVGSVSPDYMLNKPLFINEYSWLWVMRTGEMESEDIPHSKDCKQFSEAISKTYERILGGDNTPQARLEMYMRYTASLTEFWRHGRNSQGVQFFNILSNGDGCTSDPLNPDISTPKLNRYAYKYLKPSFATVSVVIDKWWEEANGNYQTFGARGETVSLPVSAINDGITGWSGTITINLENNNGDVQATTSISRDLDAYSHSSETEYFDIPSTLQPGEYWLTTHYIDDNNESVKSYRKIRID
jgi:beta-galactosidase